MLLTSWLRGLCRGRVRVHSSIARRSNRSAQSLAPAVMSLESRVLLSSYAVTNTADSGTGSLRWAVGQANTDGGNDTITFDPTIFATQQTITLTSGQIDLNDFGGISITGPLAGVKISGGNNSGVFEVSSSTSASLTDVTITGGNSGIAYGGGLFIDWSANAILLNCTISGNTSASRGGGIFGAPNSQITLIDSTVSGNTSYRMGGIGSYGTLTMTNSTVSGNLATSDVGGIFEAGTLTMTNVTVSGNISGGSIGGVAIGGGSLTLNNSIVTGNTASGSADDLVGSVGASGSNNLIGTGGSDGLVNGVNGNIVGVADPQVGPLANNGGPTQTMALLAGSLAIHAGMDGTGIPLTDQRGVPRIGGVDIGAYQGAFSGPLVVNTTDGGNRTVPNKLTLFEAVEMANYQAGADSITFDPTVFSTPQTITLTAGQLELMDSATTTITAPTAGVTISGNSASRVFQVDSGATANLNGLTITGGSTTGNGGGLDVVGTLVLTNSTISGNTANDGSGIFIESAGSATLSSTVIANNSAQNDGGGIYSKGVTVLTNCTVSGNTAGIGGGVYVGMGSITVTNTTVKNNAANVKGGGIFTVANVTATLTNCTISGNSAQGQDGGGGIYSNGTLNLSDSTISGNTTAFHGGGVYINAGHVALTNDTISGNSALVGGGLKVWKGQVTLTNVTVSGNTATSLSGGIFNAYGSLTINNTIVAGNTYSAGGASDIKGDTLVSGSNNLIGTGGSGGLINGINGNQIGVSNPQLGSLANNGGPTQTMALLAGSPAIHAGLDGTGIPLTDQRGVPRIGGVDIGAYQGAFSGPLVVNTTDGGNRTVPNKLTLFEAVEMANYQAGADSITFDPTVFSTPQTITLTAGQLELMDSAATTITAPTAGLTISGNNTSRVFQVDTGATADLNGLTITGGYSDGYGGGVNISSSNATANLTNCTVTGNSAAQGGGVCVDRSSQVTLMDSTLSGNTAYVGGGIFGNSAILTLSSSTIRGNTARQGAGVDAASCTTSMINVTISGNTSTAAVGGGLFANSGVTSLTNVTISGNTSIIGGAGIYNTSQITDLTLNNSIVAGNSTARGASDISLYTTIGPLTPVSGSNNLIGTGGSGGLVNGVSGNQVGVANPGLGSLANNGGPTQTMALLAGSPAIHAGMDGTGIPMTDQRGVPRVGGVDIGAYQVAFSGPLVVNTTDGGNLNVPGKLTLFEAVTLANYQPGADTITFDPAVFATPQTITLTAGQLELTDSAATTITAPMAGVTISGNNTSRVFQVDGGATADFNGLTITGGNSSKGGGVYVTGNASGTLTNCTVSGNTATVNGGGVFVDRNCNFTLINSTVSGNNAINGGGIFGIVPNLTLTNSTVSGNTATAEGGGVIVQSGTLTITNATISDNTATVGGGGVIVQSGTLTIANATISDNLTHGSGGGFVADGINGVLTNLTISGNSSDGLGAGIILSDSHLTLNNSIVARNANVSSASDISIGSRPSVFSGSNNLIGTGGSGGLVNGTNGNIVGVTNPLLAPLGNYGGPTQTIALLPGSPAIDAGNSSLAIGTTDQRDKPYVGTVDIGAFESQGFTLTPVTGSTPQSTLNGTAFTNPLAVTVTANNAVEPVNGGVVTYTVPGSGPSATLAGNPATIASGTASVTATANSTLGAYNVTATASGVMIPAAFNLVNAETPSLIVNTTSDSSTPYDGLTSLREAIAYANTFTSSAPTIAFDSTVFGSAQTITLTGTQLGLADTVEPITITAPTAGLTINGNGASRVFEIYKGATANLTGLTITGGNAGVYYGGGVYAGGTVTLASCVVTGNSAGQGGGGVDSYTGGSVTLSSTTVSNNKGYNGGGVFVGSGSALTMTDCTVSGNTATANGGGVDGFGTFNLENSTFSGNTASFTGGAIAIGYSNATLTNLTISGNYAKSAGGGLYDYRANITLNNTIVAGNTNSGGTSDIGGNSAVTGSNNLIGAGGSDGLVNGSNGNQVGVANPLLAPLANYGGATWTMALLPGSPAIDAGSNALALTTSDQRGEPRVGNVDIGAFESQGFTLTSVAGSTPQTGVTGYAFPNPLGVTVTANNPGEPVNGGLINFTVPLSGPSATLSSTSATIGGGQASVTATANLVLGGFNATASTTEGTTATFSLNNIAPVALSGLGGSVTYVQGGNPVAVAPAIVVTQSLGQNIASATVDFTNLQIGDRLDFNNPFALQHTLVLSPDGTTATLTLTGISSAANYQATLRTIVFSCVAANPSTSPRSAAFTVTDVLTNSATGSQTINVTLANQAPVLSGIENYPLTYLVNYVTYQPQNITNTLSIFDADSNNLTSAKVQITAGYQNDSNSHDLLSLVPQFGLTSSFDPTTGTLTLTGSASVSNYRVALQSVTFHSSGPAVNTTPRTISFTVYDDSTPSPLASNTVTRDVDILLPPTLSGLNGTSTFIQGGSPVPIASTIGVNPNSDSNMESAIVTFTHLQPGDRFDFHNQFALQHSLTYSPDETSATLLIDGIATPAQYQATLQSIIYWNVANTPNTTPRTASFTVIAVTGQQSLPGAQNFTVALANQPPKLSGIEQTPLVYAANHPEFPPQPVTNTLLVTDPDSNNLTSATVQITSGYQNNLGGNDVLSFVNQLGISGVFNAATGTMTLSGLSSLQNYRAALQSVTFSTSGPNVAAGTRTLTFTAFDDTTPTPLASNQVTRTVQVTTTNASPVLSGLVTPIIYVKGSSPSLIAPSLQVTDADSPLLFGATISFTNWLAGDRIDFYNQFALQHTFTEDLVAQTASLTITGPTSVANYQTMLQSIGFYNVAGNPALNTRYVSIVVNDGYSNSNTVTGDIYVQPF